MRLIFFATFMLTLAACGGGGGQQTPGPSGGSPPTTPADPPRNEPVRPTEPTAPADPPRNESVQPAEPETHRGASLSRSQVGDNTSQRWHADPHADLPRHGRHGLRVEWAKGGLAIPRLVFDPYLNDVLEPGWRYDSNARARLDTAAGLLWRVTNLAYTQWARHLDYDPGVLTVDIGNLASRDCFHPTGDTLGCYLPAQNKVVLDARWIRERYGDIFYRPGRYSAALQELFLVASHEAGHQFHYGNPTGTTDGCGDDGSRCHAPYGSGSVMSYDHRRGRSVRYNVTLEDIRYIPNATWNGDEVDRYTVSKSAAPPSVDGWGVWIDHTFRVSGRTAPGRLSGGNLSITDEVAGTGWVRGKPSARVSLTGTATWSGEDNFLGVDLGPDFLGALLRADANLRYTFGERPNLNLRVSDFEAHYAVAGVAEWHDHSFTDWGDFSYSMDCTSGGCSGADAEAKWYADGAGDPSGWVGGVVNDRDNAYTGSFVAERD